MKNVKKLKINKRLYLLILILIVSLPVALVIVNWKSTLSFVYTLPKKLDYLTTKTIDDNSLLANIRYEYLIRTSELPTVPSTSTIEIDKGTGWYRYTDTIGELSFIFPSDWKLETWEGRSEKAWEENIGQEGMNWNWFQKNPMTILTEDIPFILLESSEKNTLIILSLSSDNNTTKQSLQELINSGVNDQLIGAKIMCPAIKNGSLRCEPHNTTALLNNHKEKWNFKFKIIGSYSEETKNILASFLTNQ